MSVSQSAEDSSLFYRTQVTSHYEAAFRLANDLDYNGEKYQKPQEFPFATEEEIYKKFAEFGESLGISINDEHTTYYLDYETLAGEEEQQVNQGNIQPKNWTEADNAYYFCTSQESQGFLSMCLFMEYIWMRLIIMHPCRPDGGNQDWAILWQGVFIQ